MYVCFGFVCACLCCVYLSVRVVSVYQSVLCLFVCLCLSYPFLPMKSASVHANSMADQVTFSSTIITIAVDIIIMHSNAIIIIITTIIIIIVVIVIAIAIIMIIIQLQHHLLLAHAKHTKSSPLQVVNLTFKRRFFAWDLFLCMMARKFVTNQPTDQSEISDFDLDFGF